MKPAEPSRTALRVALRRAAHQLVDDQPLVFPDAFAVRVLGPWARELERTPRATRSTERDRAWSRSLRAWMVGRSRYAEDCLARAVEAGVRQYVLLGAGLDTFALRNPWPGVQVWELDHPATQAAKQQLLGDAGLASPARYVAADFEHASLGEMLGGAGLRLGEPAVFAMLGVAPYLTHEGFQATVEFTASMPAGTGLVLDYGQPRAVLPPHEQLAHDSLAARVAQVGEPFRLFWTPGEMALELRAFAEREDLGRDELNARYFAGRGDGLAVLGEAPRVVCAFVR